jgi:hypothetical protein
LRAAWISTVSWTKEAEAASDPAGPLKALERVDLVGLDAAAAMFPLDHDIRERSAHAALSKAWMAPPRVVLREIDRALRSDPYSPYLLAYREAVRWDLHGDVSAP